MKKNVFSRAIAVLASMTVLGAASMMSASAEGIRVETVTVPAGTTEVTVGISLDGDVSSQGCTFTVTWPAELTATSILPGAMAVDTTSIENGAAATFVAATGLANDNFTSITFELPADAAGEYPITMEVGQLDNGGEYQENPESINGAIIVEEAVTEETTEAPTEEETEAPTTTTVATTAKPASTGSPKTGSAGVAVAVAGLVTAGATAVVLKKRH